MQTAMSHTTRAACAYPSPTESAGVTATALGVLAATGVVGAAYHLGAAWLTTPVLGLPAGVWAVPAVYGVIRWGMVRPRWVAMQITGGLNHVLFGGARPTSIGSPRSSLSPWSEFIIGVGGAAASLASRCGRPAADWLHARTGGRTPDASGLERSFCTWHDRTAWPARLAHVAVVGASDRIRRSLTDADGASGVRWFVGDDRLDDQDQCERHGYDAVLTSDADGRLHLATHEREGRDASWYDWGVRRPLCYASVFPGRLDPFLATLGPVEPDDAAIVGAVVNAACILSRHPARLSAVDRVRGRRPIDLPLPAEQDGSTGHPVVASMEALAEQISQWPIGRPPTDAVKVAARVVSAYLAGTACAQDPVDRLPALESAARILPGEPEALLRLAAVRFAAGDDEGGLGSLAQADEVLRNSGEVAQVDPFAFLQAELEAGESSPMTVGRVAAGICMVCARTPVERLPYLRDDIMDDMRYADWLVGSDPDRLLLYRVFDEIGRARRTAEPMLQKNAA